MLIEQEEIIVGLIKESQKDCFERGKLSMNEYFDSLIQYEKRLGNIVQDIVHLEIAKSNLLAFLKGKTRVMMEEREKLLKLIRKTQEIYMQGSNMETRVYQNRMQSYAHRLAEIEEHIADLEAQKAQRITRR